MQPEMANYYERIRKIEVQRRERFFESLSPSEKNTLKIKGMHVWLLQGPKLVKNDILPKEIFLKISSYLLRLPDKGTIKILNIVQKKLYEDTLTQISKKYEKAQLNGCFSFFKNQKKALDKYNTAIQRAKISSEKRWINLENNPNCMLLSSLKK